MTRRFRCLLANLSRLDRRQVQSDTKLHEFSKEKKSKDLSVTEHRIVGFGGEMIPMGALFGTEPNYLV